MGKRNIEITVSGEDIETPFSVQVKGHRFGEMDFIFEIEDAK